MAAAAKVSITVVSGEREALKLTVKGSLSMGAVSSKYEKWLAKKTGRPQAVRLEHLDGAAVDLYGAAAALDGQAVRVVLAAPAEEEAAPAEEAAAPLAEEVAAAPADPPAPVVDPLPPAPAMNDPRVDAPPPAPAVAAPPPAPATAPPPAAAPRPRAPEPPQPGKKKMGLKGAVGRGAKRRPTKKEKYARELERLAADYPETCGAAYDETREEEVFLLDLYVQNDVALGDAGVRRYVAENTTAAARLDGAAATLPRSSRERGAAARRGGGVLVSVVVPTTGRRSAFHGMLYACFAAQTHARLELVVLDTGDAPSPFFSGDPAATANARVRYAHRPGGAYDDDATGAKRNELVQKARGAVVVQFDDDDVYTPRYVERVLSAMRGAGAALFKLSAWKWFDAARGAKPDADDAKLLHWYDNERDKTTGYCANYTAAGWHSRKWGYGFSFAFDRAVALRHPFPPTYLGEDYDFSFFKKSFAVELCAKAGLAPAQVRESLLGLGATPTPAVAGRPCAVGALTLRSLAPGRAPCRSTFVVNASSSAKAPDGSGDRAAWAALCEGHGPQGEQCAKFARDRMEHLVRRAMSAPYATPPAALANAFAALDGALDEARCGARSGCSAAAALLSGDRAYCALLGTCGVVLVTKDRQGCHARELAPRHVLSVAAEADRARAAGAVVCAAAERRAAPGAFGSDEALLGVLEAGDGGDRRPRLYAAEEGSTLPGYSFARCLGDPAAKRLGVVAEPSVVEHEFGPGDEFLILASESVFDALRSDAFATICEGQDDRGPQGAGAGALAPSPPPPAARGAAGRRRGAEPESETAATPSRRLAAGATLAPLGKAATPPALGRKLQPLGSPAKALKLAPLKLAPLGSPPALGSPPPPKPKEALGPVLGSTPKARLRPVMTG
ncbi:protein serine/threonine phosphatase [Aureococcus anophagefferens]|nr:protein serine/threonine phosphatase [Aureococcus anophagefferens]